MKALVMSAILAGALQAPGSTTGATTGVTTIATPRTVTIEPGFELAGHMILDVNHDERAEFIVLARDGRVRTWRLGTGEAGAPAPLGELRLAHPTRTLVDVDDFGGKGYLVTESPAGTIAYAIDAGGTISSEGVVWIPRAKFALRLAAPTFSPIVQDVNHDGTNDVIVPTLAGCELWLGTLGADEKPPTFRKAATVAVRISRSGSHAGQDLSDELESSFTIPGLDTRDVNGDERPDLLVEQGTRRAFHLQREDGSFPVQPDVEVDLAVFRDTIEKAQMQLGGTLTVGDDATYTSRDLDQDGIPDYVIGHRRKVWVFRGTHAGPQFKEPSAILKTAEDITALVVMQLDLDDAPDLLLVKVQIPTLATLLRGLFGEWDVHIQVLGYKNKGGAGFESQPAWRNELLIRLPGIVGVMKNPEKILERFEGIGKRFRKSARGDVDGDGIEDTLLVTEQQNEVEIWLGNPTERDSGRDAEDTGEADLRAILFDEEDQVWDIDRVVMALGDLAERRVALKTGGRPVDRALDLRKVEESEFTTLECADLDGDGRDEIVLGYRRVANRRSVSFDVLRLDGRPERDGDD